MKKKSVTCKTIKDIMLAVINWFGVCQDSTSRNRFVDIYSGVFKKKYIAGLKRDDDMWLMFEDYEADMSSGNDMEIMPIHGNLALVVDSVSNTNGFSKHDEDDKDETHDVKCDDYTGSESYEPVIYRSLPLPDIICIDDLLSTESAILAVIKNLLLYNGSYLSKPNTPYYLSMGRIGAIASIKESGVELVVFSIGINTENEIIREIVATDVDSLIRMMEADITLNIDYFYDILKNYKYYPCFSEKDSTNDPCPSEDTDKKLEDPVDTPGLENTLTSLEVIYGINRKVSLLDNLKLVNNCIKNRRLSFDSNDEIKIGNTKYVTKISVDDGGYTLDVLSIPNVPSCSVSKVVSFSGKNQNELSSYLSEYIKSLSEDIELPTGSYTGCCVSKVVGIYSESDCHKLLKLLSRYFKNRFITFNNVYNVINIYMGEYHALCESTPCKYKVSVFDSSSEDNTELCVFVSDTMSGIASKIEGFISKNVGDNI